MPAVPQDFADWKKSVDDQLQLLAGRAQIRPPQNTATSGDLLVGPSQALRVKATGGVADQTVIGWDGGQRVARIYRADGTIALSVVAGTATLWDLLGQALVQDDTGGGLARPYLPMVAAPARTADWLATTNGSFEDVWRLSPLKLNPRATITVGHIADATTAGEVQVTVAGSPVAAATTVGTTQGSTVIGPFTLPGAQEASVDIRVQARRTSGAGSVRVAVLAASGFHS